MELSCFIRSPSNIIPDKIFGGIILVKIFSTSSEFSIGSESSPLGFTYERLTDGTIVIPCEVFVYFSLRFTVYSVPSASKTKSIPQCASLASFVFWRL